MLPVPICRQANDAWCGVSALAACLVYWHVWDGNDDELAAELDARSGSNNIEQWGVNPTPIAEQARSLGLSAEIVTGLTIDDLRAYVADGATAILMMQAWPKEPVDDWWNDWRDGHYVVLVDVTATSIVAMDPSTRTSYVELGLSEFVSRWHMPGDGKEIEQGAIVLRGSDPMTTFPAPLGVLG